MELSLMVTELKNQMISIASDLKFKEEAAEKHRKLLVQLESEIAPLRDKYDALKMAVDALGLVPDTERPAVVEPCPVVPDPATKTISNLHHSRKPKRIGKFDPKGKKIGEYASITQAAKELGWNNTSMAKYVEGVSKDKQIRLRGYYLEFLAA